MQLLLMCCKRIRQLYRNNTVQLQKQTEHDVWQWQAHSDICTSHKQAFLVIEDVRCAVSADSVVEQGAWWSSVIGDTS